MKLSFLLSEKTSDARFVSPLGHNATFEKLCNKPDFGIKENVCLWGGGRSIL